MGRFTDRTNESKTMNNGLKATIIGYHNNKNIDIQFENGQTAHHKTYMAFKDGFIKCPTIIEYHEDYAKIINPNTKDKSEFLIDIEDISLIKDKWCSVNNMGYVQLEYKNKKVLLHRLIMNVLEESINIDIDHINHNTTDNRKVNLRIASRSENKRNVLKQKNNTSGYKGVCWDRSKNKWQSGITVNNKSIFIGRFDNKLEAAQAYNKAAIKYHGEFAELNDIQE